MPRPQLQARQPGRLLNCSSDQDGVHGPRWSSGAGAPSGASLNPCPSTSQTPASSGGTEPAVTPRRCCSMAVHSRPGFVHQCAVAVLVHSRTVPHWTAKPSGPDCCAAYAAQPPLPAVAVAAQPTSPPKRRSKQARRGGAAEPQCHCCCPSVPSQRGRIAAKAKRAGTTALVKLPGPVAPASWPEATSHVSSGRELSPSLVHTSLQLSVPALAYQRQRRRAVSTVPTHTAGLRCSGSTVRRGVRVYIHTDSQSSPWPVECSSAELLLSSTKAVAYTDAEAASHTPPKHTASPAGLMLRGACG